MTVSGSRSSRSLLYQALVRHRFRLVSAVILAVVLAAVVGGLSTGAIQAQSPGPCDPPLGNAIVCENQNAGSPASEWDIVGAGDSSIQGFATDISVNRGHAIEFKIDTTATDYRLDIYRMGYYGGLGARKIATVSPSATLPQTQPACLNDAATGLIDCGNWAVSASWLVPADATSGIYFAKVTRTDTGGASHIVFVVRNDASHGALFMQTSDTTWQAYNQYGGNSLYVGGPGTNPARAYKVSYNRPFTTRETAPEDWVFNAEYPMVRWLEANGYDTSYGTGVDSDRNGALILNHKVFLSVGHDEYWSGNQRAQVEAARAAGVHLAFFSGNEVFWKTRWEPAISADATGYRTLVSYKETHANGKIDPQVNEWTGTWADPRFSPPADGGKPQNALTGTLFSANCCTSAITVPAADGQMRFWRNTAIAALAPGDVATLPDGTLGYEWDSVANNGFSPAGLLPLSHTTVAGMQVMQDYGSTYATGTATHSLTLYRDPSGALVFGAGTVQWSWGLDSSHDRGSAAPDASMQQATVNLLADMGVQPLSLRSGLIAGTASTDTLAPSSTITFPSSTSVIAPNTDVTISGLAVDLGGGQVAAVEVSVDGGVTWRLATGRQNWSFVWHTGVAGSVTVLSRAVDDTGNREQPGTGVSLNVGNFHVTAPGGPVLVVTSATNPFTTYYAEILRAEGLNAFSLMDVSAVTPAALGPYDVVLLGEMALTDPQASTFADWVTGGGNLIAMRPDAKLATLLGLTPAGSTLADAYLAVDTSVAPGAGIVGESMQFHGTADRYTLNGATAVATLYSTASAPTVNPAVTTRSVGSAGGHAAAFSYDLARSVVYTRQGNPAWSGQDRDGQPPTRSDDLFFGGAQPDYVDLTKVAIPQADEQQRLLANLIVLLNSSRKPLPRFWYLPRGLKAAVVMTGDDHALNGTAERFDIYNANSAPGCSVADWECVRATSYMFAETPITPAQVDAYRAQGFEISAHMLISGPEGCNNYTPSSIFADYTNQLSAFSAQFGTATPVRTNRTHCVIWSDYDTQPQTAAAHGIRLDTNYYYWPDAWVNNVPGVFTGSGMPMRFAKADGTTIDVYQATTQMTDESGQTYPFTVDTLLDRALGPEGYYGAFVANMHTDFGDHPGSAAIVASAKARGVPIVSAEQMLDWLDGRNASTFDAIAWNGTALSFTVSQAAGARGLRAMIPATVGTGALATITRGGAPVSFTVGLIKGVNYAMFPAESGSYTAQYAADTTAPGISSLAVAPGQTTAVVTWTTNEPATSSVVFGTAPGALTSSVTSLAQTLTHSVQLTGLTAETTYYYRAVSADAAGNSTTTPATATAPATFVTVGYGCPCSIWTPDQAPVLASADDPVAVELGARFRTGADGFITAIRFYKGAQNAGPHVGSLWTNAGVLLGTAVFTGETASGWQQAQLIAPVHVTPNTTYVVSYHTNSGNYAADAFSFAGAGVSNGPLQALADGIDGPTGVYKYGLTSFPTETSRSTNYWVDVVFETTFIDTFPPVVTNITPLAGATDLALDSSMTVTFNEDVNPVTVTTATIELRDSSNTLVPAQVTYNASTRTATLDPVGTLAFGTTYTVRVAGGSSGVKDIAGNPLAIDVTSSFTTVQEATFGVADTTFADFSAGTTDAGGHVAQVANGEVILNAAVAEEFNGTTLPAGWTSTPWGTGGAASVDAGRLSVDGVLVGRDATVPSGQSLEFVATFSDLNQHVGFATTLEDSIWAIFSTRNGGGLWARTNNGIAPIDTLLAGNWLGTPHRYRIEWNTLSVVFSIDGTVVALHPLPIATNMRPIASDFDPGGALLTVDWMRLMPYATTGTFTSRVLDAALEVNWSTAQWTAQLPAGTTLTLSARFGNTSTPDASWTSWIPLTASGDAIVQRSRYVQYRATLTGDGSATPVLQDITFRGPLAPAPGAFAKTAPANAAAAQPSSLTLHWGASAGADSYEYCVDTVDNGVCDAGWTTTPDTSASLSGLTEGRTYWWQVRGVNLTGTTDANAGSWWSFTTQVALPGTFSKAAPSSGQTAIVATTTLSWAASSGAVSYQYCYDTTNNDSCDATWIDAGSSTSATLTGLTIGSTYYWQVRAQNPAGTTVANGGTWWTFSTLALPAAFAKTAPASGASDQTTSPALTWSASAGADSYEYCVDTVNNAACDTSWTSTTTTSAALSGLTSSTTYYWQVRARNAAGTTDANTATWWAFTTATPPARVIGLSGDLGFGSVTVGSTATRTLTISNSGNVTLTVASIDYPAGFSGAWSGTVAAGSSQAVPVTFAPSAATAYGGTVTVNGNQTSGTNTIAASGTAVPLAPVEITNFAGNVPSPILSGTTATWTAVATGGAAPLQYQFWRFNITTGQWTVLQSYSSSNAVTWTPTDEEAGTYRLQVWVRSSGSQESYDAWRQLEPFDVVAAPAPRISALSCTPASPVISGASVSCSAAVTGGNNVEYKFWHYTGATAQWSVIQEYSASNSATWTAGSAGTDSVQVWVRNRISTATYQDWRSTPVQIVAPRLSLSPLTVDVTVPTTVGARTTWSVTASGVSAPVEFKFWLYSATTQTWSVLRDYAAANTVVWTPTLPGQYQVQVWARSVGFSDSYEAWTGSGVFAVTVPAALTVTSITSNVTLPVSVGTPLTWTAQSGGGVAPVEYQFWLFETGSGWSILRPYAASATVTWTPARSGTYSLQVWARSTGSSNSYDAWAATPSFDITPVAITISDLSTTAASPRHAGQPQTWTTAASAGGSPLEYRYWVYREGVGWTAAGNYAASNTFVWTPPAAGNYSIQVWVRRVGSPADWETWTGTGLFAIVP